MNNEKFRKRFIVLTIVFGIVALMIARQTSAQTKTPCTNACETVWTRIYKECNDIVECERYARRGFAECIRSCKGKSDAGGVNNP